jgi:pimeloyl-ACP methyl ester carboxylesterase
VPRYLSPSELFPAGVVGLTTRFVELSSGLRVRVVEADEGKTSSAPPVVLLSGWGCSAYLYRHNLPALAAAGLRAIAVDLKGQGGSDKPLDPHEYTLDSLVAHTLDVLDALGAERAMLVGLSLGGAIATRVALAAPARVRKLALLDAVGLGRVRLVGWLRFFPAVLDPLLPYLARRWMFAAALRAAYGILRSPSAADVDQYFAPARDPAFVRSLFSLLREVDWRPLTPAEVRRLSMPVLAIFGTRDRLVSPREMETILRHAPDARTDLIADAGHAVAEEAPEAVNRALVPFLLGP